MNKSDLKTGMLVMHRDGEIQLLVNETFLTQGDWFNDLDNYNEILACPEMNSCDIVKVSKVLEKSSMAKQNWTESTIDNNLLWECPKKATE